MTPDSFSEVTSQSWLSRLGKSFKNILAGILLFILSFPLLFWNEGNAIKTAKSLDEGAGAVVIVADAKVLSENEGKLVHFGGTAVTEDVLTDPQFAISDNVLKLKREVWMFQWEEESKSNTVKKLGGGTETETKYTYKRKWANSKINSSNFKKPVGHINPDQIPFNNEEIIADNVMVGEFTLNSNLIGSISNYAPVKLDEPILESLPESFKSKASVLNDTIYVGDQANPQVGDIKIVFSKVSPVVVSVIAKQIGQKLMSYQTKVGKNIEMLSIGDVTAEEMFAKAQSQNTIITWLLRVLGFLFMFIGIKLMLGWITVIADVIPFIGSLLGFGTSLIAGGISFSLSLITIAIAWLFYRPIIGVLLIIVAVGVIFGVHYLNKRKIKLNKTSTMNNPS